MNEMCKKGIRERITERARTEQLGNGLAWARFRKYYQKAIEMALLEAFPDEFENDRDLFEN